VLPVTATLVVTVGSRQNFVEANVGVNSGMFGDTSFGGVIDESRKLDPLGRLLIEGP